MLKYKKNKDMQKEKDLLNKKLYENENKLKKFENQNNQLSFELQKEKTQ